MFESLEKYTIVYLSQETLIKLYDIYFYPYTTYFSFEPNTFSILKRKLQNKIPFIFSIKFVKCVSPMKNLLNF